MTGVTEACHALDREFNTMEVAHAFALILLFTRQDRYVAEMRLDPEALRTRVQQGVLTADTQLPVLEINGVTDGPFLPRYKFSWQDHWICVGKISTEGR